MAVSPRAVLLSLALAGGILPPLSVLHAGHGAQQDTATAVPAALARTDMALQPAQALPGESVRVLVRSPCDATGMELSLPYTSLTGNPWAGSPVVAAPTSDGSVWTADFVVPRDAWHADGPLVATARCQDGRALTRSAALVVQGFGGLHVTAHPGNATPGERVALAMTGCRGMVLAAVLRDSRGRSFLLWGDQQGAAGDAFDPPSGFQPRGTSSRGYLTVPRDAATGPALLDVVCTQMATSLATLTVVPTAPPPPPAPAAPRAPSAPASQGPVRTAAASSAPPAQPQPAHTASPRAATPAQRPAVRLTPSPPAQHADRHRKDRHRRPGPSPTGVPASTPTGVATTDQQQQDGGFAPDRRSTPDQPPVTLVDELRGLGG